MKPDVIITHRSCDYHPDHRACGQLVCDCSYMVGVPLFCPDVPALRKAPVILFTEDRFTQPAPFRADIAVACIIEHGKHGGEAAGPVCKAILDTYYGKKTETEE